MESCEMEKKTHELRMLLSEKEYNELMEGAKLASLRPTPYARSMLLQKVREDLTKKRREE